MNRRTLAWRSAALTMTFGAAGAVAGCVDGDTGPVEAGPLTFSESDVLVLGSSDVLAEVLDLEVLSDGSVWVLNSVEPFFMHFASDGTVLGAHGTEGGGPGEFLIPAGFVSGGLRDSVWVLDARRHALVNVSDTAGERSTIALPPESVPPGSVVSGMSLLVPTVRLARLGSEVVIPRSSGSLRDGLMPFRMSILQADMLALDPATGSVRDIVALGDVLGDPSVGFELTDSGFPIWYRLWDVCGSDDLRVYDRARNELRTLRSDGSEAGATALPAPQFTEVSPRQFAAAIFEYRAAEVRGTVTGRLSADDSLRVINEIASEVQGSPAQLANYLPRYVDIRCSEEGVAWLRPLDVDRGALQGSLTWLRIESAGAIQEVTLPEGFDPLRFTGTRIWGIQRDALDIPSIAWIDLEA